MVNGVFMNSGKLVMVLVEDNRPGYPDVACTVLPRVLVNPEGKRRGCCPDDVYDFPGYHG